MPRKTDFSVTPAGAVIRAALLEEYRAYRARPVSDVTLPAPLTVFGHNRLRGFAPVEAQAIRVH
ncbi:hypothetical protein [Falsigemmobacter faecalis]|uniref:Uncharacterized protein n=1 Tax=Falsigemmobacter faecalis TaxID=2488730 RepID=A0A3P3DCF4_9RHOB|nr:hypothetical protein [Falsigemmobacter faecalis]RRH72019.1 hypothetical protein EG244_16015 [Falsigemmobacter faecalis]